MKRIRLSTYTGFLYRWGLGEYVEAERNELTEDEKQTLNKRLIEDAEVDE